MSPSSSDQQSNFLLIGPNDKPSDFGLYGIVYKATNEINGKVYIGLTTRSLNERRKEHITASKSRVQYYFYQAIRKYGAESFLFEVIEECTSREALVFREGMLISEYKSYVSENGYNLTYGGEGGRHLSLEVRQKISESHKGKKASAETLEQRRKARIGKKATEETKRKQSESLKGRTFSEETRKLISIANTGKKRSDEVKLQMSQRRKGRKHSEETKQRMSRARKGHKTPEETKKKISKKLKGKKQGWRALKRKAVEQLTLQGNLVNEFVSIAEAARSCGLISQSISRVCTGKLKTSGGFVWRFKNEEYRPLGIKQEGAVRVVKQVIQLDKCGTILNEFCSLEEASDKSGVSVFCISRVCQGKRKSSGGFFWRFKNDDDVQTVWKPPVYSLKGKIVIQMNTEGRILGEFLSSAEASRKSGVGSSNILKACKGRIKTAGGFIWKYKEDIQND